jgi:hypothetical protein
MTKMGNKLLEKGLYLSGNCSYCRRSSPSSSTATLNIAILTPVDCKIRYIPPYALARSLQRWFADRRWISRTHTKFFGTHDDRDPRAAGRTNPRRFTFPSPARYSAATRCSDTFADRHPRTCLVYQSIGETDQYFGSSVRTASADTSQEVHVGSDGVCLPGTIATTSELGTAVCARRISASFTP